jgi:hypothetical protein
LHIFASFIHHQDNQYNQHFRNAQGSSVPTLVRTLLLRSFVIKTISIIITLEVIKAILFPAWFALLSFVHSSSRQSVLSTLYKCSRLFPSQLGSHILASSVHHQVNQYNQHFRSAQGSSLPCLVRTFMLRSFIIKTISIINTL